MKTVDLVKELVSIPCVAGDEDKLVSYLIDKLSPYGKAEKDALGNVVCTFGDGYHIMLDAHIDEIGMIVTSISDDGFIKVGAVGGIDRRMLLGYEVDVWGKQKIRGIISTLPPHLQKSGDDKSVPEISEISIDVGMSRSQVEEIVSLGDRVTFRRQFTPLLNNQVSSNCLDDRAGVAALLLSVEKLKKLPLKITVLLSTQEEVGTRGAKIGPYGKNADECIAVDVSFGYTPNCSKEECGIVGKGAMIGFSPVLDRDISKALVDTAKKHNIAFQQEIMSGKTGTNADVITISEAGVKCGLISIPLKYMHSPVEVVDISDIERVSNLIVAYAKEKAGACDA